jgi:uncharacterized membrane protein YkoI
MRALCISLVATVATLVLAPAAQAQAPAPATCLSKDQRREMIATGKVVPLSAARRAVPHPRGELVRASLCESPTGLVYLLTLVARDGKVTRATVDAGSGKLAEVR